MLPSPLAHRSSLLIVPALLVVMAVVSPAHAEDARVVPDVIDPWKPAASPPEAVATWSAESASDLLDPWAEPQRTRAERYGIVDPWKDWRPSVPTARFPSAALIDPWSSSAP